MSGILYVIGTPIGNLEDITSRALRILGEVDLVVAEDTRHSKKLLSHFSLQKPLLSFHKFSPDQSIARVLGELKEGKSIAYLVDAGTPGVSDPGSFLVQRALESSISVIPIPGVSAVTTLLSVAGIPCDRFIFYGFLPRKKGRATALKEIAQSPYPVILFESPHRIKKTLDELEKLGDFSIALGRELTKKFETIYRGNLADVNKQLTDKHLLGEFTLIVENVSNK